MKQFTRIVLSLMLSCSLIFCSGMPISAAETAAQDKLDAAMEDLLAFAKTCGQEVYNEDEQETFEILAEDEGPAAVTYCMPDTDYVATKNSYYVSLGDSTVTGMHLEGYSNYGYMTKVPGSYPYKVATQLNLNIDSQYEQLACGGFRAEDIRFILDETFEGDGYTTDNIIHSLNVHAGGLDAARLAFKENLAKADLVSVGIGGNSFGTFTNAQLSRYENGEELIEINWHRYLDDDFASTIEDLLDGIHSLLLEAGLSETDAQIAMLYVESLLYGYVGFASTFGATLNKIHEYSPNSKIIIVGLYNITKGVYLDVEGIRLDIGSLMEKLISFGNAHFKIYAEMNDFALYVDVPDTETFKDIAVANGKVDLSLFNYLDFTDDEAPYDDHPSDAGHTYIANQILSSINYTPVPEEPEVETPKQPEIVEPGTEEPEIVEPGTEEPEIVEPGTEEPEITEPDTEEPDTEEPEVEVPDTEEPDDEPAAGTSNSPFSFLKKLTQRLTETINKLSFNWNWNFKFPSFRLW